MPYQSLRTLREELTGVRLGASDTSLWSIVTTVNQKARNAINDAVRTYPFESVAVYSSAILPSSGVTIAIPPAIERIINIEAVEASGLGTIVPRDFDHIPTGTTNLLTVHITRAPTTTFFLKIEYARRTEMFPEDLSLAASVTSSGGTVQVARPEALAHEWEPEGYLELSDPDVDNIEVCYYNSIQHDLGFNVIGRGQLGTPIGTWAVGSSITVSPVISAPPESVAVIMAGAEANMFNFWLSHRALYDQYTALTGLQTLDIAELLGIVRTTEDRADRRYRKLKKVPRVTQAKLRIRSDR